MDVVSVLFLQQRFSAIRQAHRSVWVVLCLRRALLTIGRCLRVKIGILVTLQ